METSRSAVARGMVAAESKAQSHSVRGESKNPVRLDRRCVRSRRMIYRAMVDLVEERGIDGFTVSDLTERADLNRSTFYSHFKDKDDLIKSCEDDFLDELIEVESEIAKTTPEELALAVVGDRPLNALVELFDFLAQNSTMLHALISANGDIGFEHRLLDTVGQTIINKILNQQYKDNTTRLVEFYVAYYSSAALGLVRTWMEGGMKETPEQMSNLFVQLAFLEPGKPIKIEGEIDD